MIDVESQKSENEKEETKQYHLMVYAAPKAISAAYAEFAENAGLSMTGITYTGDSIYHSVRGEYAKGTHILVKIELKGTSITIIRDGELALQRNINYGVDSAVETVRAFPEFGDRLDVNEALTVLCSRRCINSALEMESPGEAASDEESDDGNCQSGGDRESALPDRKYFPNHGLLYFPPYRYYV